MGASATSSRAAPAQIRLESGGSPRPAASRPPSRTIAAAATQAALPKPPSSPAARVAPTGPAALRTGSSDSHGSHGEWVHSAMPESRPSTTSARPDTSDHGGLPAEPLFFAWPARRLATSASPNAFVL